MTNESLKHIEELRERLVECLETIIKERDRLREALRDAAFAYHLYHPRPPDDVAIGPLSECAHPKCRVWSRLLAESDRQTLSERVEDE